MLVVCWSAKGGSGVTATSATLALLHAEVGPTLLVDLDGDIQRALGLIEGKPRAGVTDWFLADPSLKADALSRLLVEAGPNLNVLPFGRQEGVTINHRLDELTQWLRGWSGTVVVDIGNHSLLRRMAQCADTSLLVMRCCYLNAHAACLATRPTGLIVLEEAGRQMTAHDLATSLGVPVVARIPHDRAMAGAIDTGLVHSRLPRTIRRGLRPVLEHLATAVAG